MFENQTNFKFKFTAVLEINKSYGVIGIEKLFLLNLQDVTIISWNPFLGSDKTKQCSWKWRVSMSHQMCYNIAIIGGFISKPIGKYD